VAFSGGRAIQAEANIAGSEAMVPDEAIASVSARVNGEPYLQLPEDLYIPPDALEVFLEAFEGPLDLLLYLIRKQNLDILNIPVAQIAEQYVEYITLMREMRFELAAEYLLMAAMLAEIKSRMLLPQPQEAEGDEGQDPRAELVRRLQQYERFKSAGENLDRLPRLGREIFIARARPEQVPLSVRLPQPELRELLFALRDVLVRGEMFAHHHIQREPLSVRERMSRILADLAGGARASFMDIIEPAEGRLGVVVCFLAILELAKSNLILLRQNEPYGPVSIELAGEGSGQIAADVESAYSG
jgi:segregation and condensation protein A